jgi:predicted MPP superfamily phosphohydrolase
MKKIILAALLLSFLPFIARAEKFCLIADIHNGNGTKEKSDTNVIYPKYGNRYFKEALKRAKANGVDACIALGDNVNTGKKKDAKQLAKTAKKSGVKVLWVKGNHDSDKSQKYLSDRINYFVDFENVRVIVLDSNSGNILANGGVIPANQEFYRNSLDTDKKIILAMHHPPLDKCSYEWNQDYGWIGDRPEYVLGGHWHIGLGQGNYWAINALSLNKQLEMEYLEI